MEISSFTNTAGQKIFTRYWSVEDGAKGIVIIVHGLGEHSGRYIHVADALNTAGYVCYALDHLGHGKSEGERGTVESFTAFRDDLKQFYDSIKEQHPTDKLFMLGHSMGAVITLQFILEYPNTLDGLIITGVGSDFGSKLLPGVRSVANFLYRIVPHLPFGPPVTPNILTSDPEMIQKWHEDSLIDKGWIRISIGKFTVDSGDDVQNRAHEIDSPILIMHGELDAFAPISGSHIIYERVRSEDKTLETWANMNHEIMNEIEREKVLHVIIEWLDKH